MTKSNSNRVDYVEALDQSYPDRYLECRRGNAGHYWKRVGSFHANGYIVIAWTCGRCTTDKHDKCRANGTKVSSKYTYPAGYQIVGGVDAFDVRAEMLTRVTVYESEEQMTAALVGQR